MQIPKIQIILFSLVEYLKLKLEIIFEEAIYLYCHW